MGVNTSDKQKSTIRQVCLFPITVVCFLGLEVYKKTPIYKKKEEKRKRRERTRQLIPPPVTKRPRPLSISMQTNAEEAKTARTNSQDNSFFFRLPYEIRLMIYELVIGEKGIHIIWREGKVYSFRCHANPLTPMYHDMNFNGQGHCWDGGYGPQPEINARRYFQRAGIDVLPLMQTCRMLFVIPCNRMYHAQLIIHV